MLLNKQTIQLGDAAHMVLIDVDPDREYVLFRMGKEHSRVKKTDVFAAIFTIADAKTQADMMPVRQTEVMKYSKVHTVKLKRAMSAGEEVKVACHIDVPITVVEGLAGLIKQKSQFLI